MSWLSIAMILAGFVLGIAAIASIRWSQLSVLPDVGQSARLVTSGPYRWIRHPMYMGLMLLTAGCMVSPFDAWKLGVWLLLLGVLWCKSTYEERLLTRRFPDYAQYRSKTTRFVPFVI